MIDLDAAGGMALVALGLVLTPGPNMLYLVSRSITQGRLAGLISLLGVALGFLVYLIAAAAGVAAVFTRVPAAYMALKIGGTGYLLYLAWQAVRPGGKALFAHHELPADRPGRLVLMGLVTNLLNPKIAVLYVSLLPQFIDPSRGSVVMQSLALGGIQIGIALSVNCLIVLTAGRISVVLARRPLWVRMQRYLMGVALGGLALRLATGRGHGATAG